MINVRPSPLPTANTRTELSSPTAAVHSAASRVIELLHNRLSDAVPAHASQRIENLLRFAVTTEQPSLAEQISQLIEKNPKPLTDATLRHEVQHRLDQPSALNAQKTYAQLIQEILESPQPGTPKVRPIVPRSRRDLQSPPPAQGSRAGSIRTFAEALNAEGDAKLAHAVANSLIRQRLSAETLGTHEGQDKVAVPPDSTFGQAWAELADALHAEPFKSFADARKIDVSNVMIEPNGTLTEARQGKAVKFSLRRDADWAAASAGVLVAVKKLTGQNGGGIAFYGRNHASAYDIAAFYGLPLGRITDNDTLFTIGQLISQGTFPSLSSTDPLYATQYAPIKKQQREASQRIVDLPAQQLNQRIAQQAPLTPAQAVDQADRALAQLCSEGLAKLLDAVRNENDEIPVILKDIPEHSTYSQVRKNLMAALHGAAFTTFAQDNNLDATSVHINPVSGTLTGKVQGEDRVFTLNDLSGWTLVWGEIKEAVQYMAAGSNADISYPMPPTAALNDVMRFYKEEFPRSVSFNQPDWRQLQRVGILRRSAEVAQGFKALTDTAANGVRETQQAVKSQLAMTPVPLTPLQTLASAVQASPGAPTVSSAQALASADSELAVALHRAMLELKTDASGLSSKVIAPIPANSLFGHWQAYLDKALKGRGFTEWAREQKVDLASLRFDPAGNALIGKVEGVDQRFTVTDFAKKYPRHFDALTPVVTAAQAFAAPGKPITLSHPGNRVPFEWVANFYGVSSDPGSPAFAQSTALIGQTRQFPTRPENPQRLVNWLTLQKSAVGNSNDRYALMGQLEHGNVDNDDTTRFIVDADSSHQPKGVTTVRRFLSDHGWYALKWAAEKANLLSALRSPIPQSPPLGNHWGFLSTPLALSADQRSALTAQVKKAITPHASLLAYLSTGVSNLASAPGQALEQLISSDNGLKLATHLQTEMAGAATSTSLKQWLLSAVVLELDPAAGSSRNTLAGFDFMQREHWGLSADDIRLRLSKHLIDTKGLPANLALAASHLLMTGGAPQLLVRDVPSKVTLGSIEWASFVTAVNHIELIAPGAAVSMTYRQVMDFHAISPVSDAENRMQAIAQANPVIDWAIINNHLVKHDKDEYSLEQLRSSHENLQKQIRETADAHRYLQRFELPSRRQLALTELRAKLGTQVDLESRYLEERKLGGVLGGKSASLVEVYEAGRLGDNWHSRRPEMNVEQLNALAAQLPNIEAKFNAAIEEDITLRRAHLINLFKNMFSKLPLADREFVNNGSVRIYRVNGAGDGIVMDFTHNGEQRAFAIYPAIEKILKVANLDRSVPDGETAVQPIDAAAFKSGDDPQPGIKSSVALTLMDQNVLVDTFGQGRRFLFAHGTTHDLSTYESTRKQHLAEVLVDTLYLNKAQTIASQRRLASPANGLDDEETPVQFLEKVAQLFPGGTSAVDMLHGKFKEAFRDLCVDIIIYAATAGAGKAFTVAKSGAAWAWSKASARFIETFGAKEAESIALRDICAATASASLESVSRMQGSHFNEGQRLREGNIAVGTTAASGTTEQIKLTALRQGEHWYAYDAKTMSASGPALSGFRSETSIGLKHETLTTGSNIVTPDRLLNEDTLVVHRAQYTDVRIGDKVYRYDPKKPDALTDLESADHFNNAQGVEAFCPAGPRVKRGLNDVCFSNVVRDLNDDTARLVQGLEHKRLFPSAAVAGKPSTVVYERRLFEVTDQDGVQTLVPRALQDPVHYLPKTRGTLVKDPHFGLQGTHTLTNLEQNTRVVKLDAISALSNDQRELRGIISPREVTPGVTKRYLTVEADPLTFYYSEFDASTTEFNFKKVAPPVSSLEHELVKAHIDETESLLKLVKAPVSKAFVALPTLDSAFSTLEAAGFEQTLVNRLRTIVAPLNDEKKREFVYQLVNRLNNSNTPVALKSAHLEPLTKTANFQSLKAEEQNRFYAEQAKHAVDSQVKATGIGSENKRIPSDLNDQYRESVAQTIVNWIQGIAIESPDYVNSVLKFGAGNCGELADAAAQIIKKSGGRAQPFYVHEGDHAFTVVGGPTSASSSTVDFSHAKWKDAWIVDPWADISCKASEYTGLLKKKMAEWDAKGLEIYTSGGWRSPLYPKWIKELTTFEKRPQ